jgi:hypothetical protein
MGQWTLSIQRNGAVGDELAMTTDRLARFRDAQARRRGKNDARRIRAERDKARSATSAAPRRWPFELLQNAHDPGPRTGARRLDVRFSHESSALIFQHNGRPFEMDDLAALLSGGSSKEYESDETTGRYGTGFLVTHVLSQAFRLDGIVADEGVLEKFVLDIDRSGTEDDILKNAASAEQGMGSGNQIPGMHGLQTAEFRFAVDNQDAVAAGLDAVRQAAPFLFGTCDYLGSLWICNEGGADQWDLQEERSRQVGELELIEREVLLKTASASSRVSVLRVMPTARKDCGLVLVIQDRGTGWELVVPHPELPRVFARQPVRISDFLPINCVLDGRFQAQEERDRIAMGDHDKELLAAALGLLPALVSLGLSQKWRAAHLIAKVAKVNSAFSEKNKDEELTWWNERLGAIAKKLAQLPLVLTSAGSLPAAAGSGTSADFVLARHSHSSTSDEVDLERMWRLASDTTVLAPPVRELAEEWNDLSHGWNSLGVSVARVGLTEIAARMRNRAKKLEELPVKKSTIGWIASFLNLVGELPDHYDPTRLADGLVPNQMGDLCPPGNLLRDAGIPKTLKDIAESMGCVVRQRLLADDLAKMGRAQGCAALPALLLKLVPKELTEPAVLEDCLNLLGSSLRDGAKADARATTLIQASVQLLKYMWDTRGKDAAALAQRCPLLTRENTVAHHTAKRIMAPVASWDQRASPFAAIYLDNRVLSDLYSSDGTDIVAALVSWGICFANPLHYDRRSEVDDALLKLLTVDETDVTGVTLRDESFSQVPLLSTEVLQRCEDDPALASLLLGFVLVYLAPADQSWRNRRTVNGRSKAGQVPVNVRDALWVAELKRRPWVPMLGNEEPVRPSSMSLSPLLKPEWLIQNDAGIQFLIECFQFDVLGLRLQSLPPGIKEEVSGHLAQLIEHGGEDRTFYSKLIDDVEAQRQRQRDKDRNRRLGLAVQDAIQQYLSELGLKVDVIDRGYDFDVDGPEGVALLDTGTHEFAVGPYLLEVKATTSGDVRMTPAQARTASATDRFALCVVDLRSCREARLAEPWTKDDIEKLTKVVDALRPRVSETHSLVQAAAEQQISIQNQNKLRYVVPVGEWQAGIAIREWVKAIAPSLVP